MSVRAIVFTPLSAIFQLYRGGGNQSTWRIHRQTSSHSVVSSTPCREQDSNSQLFLIAQVVENPTTI